MLKRLTEKTWALWGRNPAGRWHSRPIAAAAVIWGLLLLIAAGSAGVAAANGFDAWGIAGAGVPGTVQASDINYSTKSYHIDMTAHEDHSVDVEENVVVDFDSEAHGIYRNIPMATDFGYRIKDVDVAGENFETYNDNENLVIKIGDADNTVTGEHSYHITYRLLFAKDKNPKADDFYLNFWFTGWKTSVGEVETTLTLPKAIDWSSVKVFGGPQGTKGNSKEWKRYFKQHVDQKKNILSFTGKDVPAGFGLTAGSDQLPEGYWKKAPDYIDSDPKHLILAHKVDISAAKEHVLSYREKLDVNLKSPMESITFQIPKNSDIYKVQNIQAGDGITADVEESDFFYNVTLTEGEKKWIGKKSLSYSYDLAYYTKADHGSAQIPLFTTASDLSQRNVSVKLSMPEPVAWSSAKYAMECNVFDLPTIKPKDFFHIDAPAEDTAVTQTMTAAWVPETYFLKITKLDLPEGYWQSTLDYDEEHMGDYLKIVVPFVLGLVIIAVLWIIYGRDPAVKVEERTTPPEGFGPAVISYMITGEIKPKEMMSTLLYFGEKGYLAIEETEKGKYKFVKQQDIPKDAEWKYAVDLFYALFEHVETVESDKLTQRFRRKVADSCRELKREYNGKYGEPIKKSSRTAQMAGFIGLGILSLLGLLFAAALTVFGVRLWSDGIMQKKLYAKGIGKMIAGILMHVIGSLVVSLVVFMLTTSLFALIVFGCLIGMGFFISYMPSRNEENSRLLGEALGFRKFLEHADQDRLKDITNTNESYFFRILPYAAAFGLVAVWSRKFKNISRPAPVWYRSHYHHGYDDRMWERDRWTEDLVRDTITTSLPKPPKSESSGWTSSSGGGFFSGGGSSGGYSGGGGGGGGGGAW